MTRTALRHVAATPATGTRKVQGMDAVATWSLHRSGRLTNATKQHAELLLHVARDASVDVERQRFSYRGRDTAVRPAVVRLLARLLYGGGQRVAVADVCAAVYGRPASLRAVRQSAFRASRVMERIDCPLVVCCHGAHVFIQYRLRRFERRLNDRTRT